VLNKAVSAGSPGRTLAQWQDYSRLIAPSMQTTNPGDQAGHARAPVDPGHNDPQYLFDGR
jgi:hypothetical protein